MELPDSFYTKSTVYLTSNDEYFDDCGDNDKRVCNDNLSRFNGWIEEDLTINQVIGFMLVSADKNRAICHVENETFNEENLPCDPIYMDGAAEYLRPIQNPMIGSSAALVSKLHTPVKFERGEVCFCFMGFHEEFADKCATNCLTEYFDHLVFDFQESQLDVKFLDGLEVEIESNYSWEPECYEEAVLRDMADCGCTGEMIEAEVNIKPLLSPDISFNHASCQCVVYPGFELHEFYNLKQYLHLTALTLYAKEKDGKMIVWTIYNGIVAL